MVIFHSYVKLAKRPQSRVPEHSWTPKGHHIKFQNNNTKHNINNANDIQWLNIFNTYTTYSWRRGGCEASVFGDGNSSWSNRTTATVTFPSSTWTACTMGRSCLSSPELASGQPGKTSCHFPSCIPASKHQQSTSACAKTVYLGSQLALMARSSQLKPFAASGLALVQLVAFPFSASTCGQPSPFWLFS